MKKSLLMAAAVFCSLGLATIVLISKSRETSHAVRANEQEDEVVIADSDWQRVSFDNINGYYKFEKNRLVIDIKETLSTGFSWSYAIEGKTVKTISDSRNTPHTKDHQSGTLGRRILEFKGLTEGTSNILFTYRRPWENKLNQPNIIINVVTDIEGYIIDIKRIK